LASDDVRVVVGSSVKLLASDSSVDLVCTDPPYHDDVKYGELSEIFRAWAGLDTSRLAGEAVVGAHEADSASYEEILKGAFEEVRRVLRPDGHLVLSYANRDHAAWVALFGSLQDAGFEAIGYQVVQSENEVDHAKANRRACNLDVLLDLVVNDGRGGRRYSPAAAPGTSEESFCHMVGKRALSVGRLTGRWRESLTDAIKAHPFVGAPRKAHV
jgi:adenine-specific DNA methylase